MRKSIAGTVSRFRGSITQALLGGLYSSFHPIIGRRLNESVNRSIEPAAERVDRELRREGLTRSAFNKLDDAPQRRR